MQDYFLGYIELQMQNNKWQYFGILMFSSLVTSLVIVVFPSIQNFLTNALMKNVLYGIVAVGFTIPAIALFLLIGYSLRLGNSKYNSKNEANQASRTSLDYFLK